MEMEKTSETPKVSVVLVGAGHSHVQVIKMLASKKLPIIITVINDTIETPYSGMLPGYIAGIYTKDASHINVESLCSVSGCRFIRESVSKIDPKSKKINFHSKRPDLRYDILSINTGCSPNLPESIQDMIESHENLIPIKPIWKFSERWKLVEAKLHSSPAKQTIVVVGAGGAGVDVSLAIRTKFGDVANVILVSNSNTILPSHSNNARSSFENMLESCDVKIIRNFHLSNILEENRLQSDQGEIIMFDFVLFCTSAKTQIFASSDQIDITSKGFIKVRDTLQISKHDNIFAAGDCCHFMSNPLPKAGVFAVREGPILLYNIWVAAKHELGSLKIRMKRYIPQKQYLGILGTGTRFCSAMKADLALHTSWMFDLKDWIDKSFMSKFQVAQYPAYQLTQDTRCAGCGSKVGSDVLRKVLQRLRDEGHINDDGSSFNDDMALLDIPVRNNSKTVKLLQTVDFFRSFTSDGYLFGQILANHSLGKSAVSASTALAVCLVPLMGSVLVEEDLFQMLAGACQVLNKEGCFLVGGHTAEADPNSSMPSPSLGLAITDTLEEGDVLVINKPIGTGVILAASMQGFGPAHALQAATSTMLQSNSTAAELFCNHGAKSCTDVTGFGLLVHLFEMLPLDLASQVDVFLDRVPLIEGALHCSKNGYTSTLYPSNASCMPKVSVSPSATKGEWMYRVKLMNDPQTAGGLMGFIPEKYGVTLIKELRENGYEQAEIIGRVVTRDNGLDAQVHIRESDHM